MLGNKKIQTFLFESNKLINQTKVQTYFLQMKNIHPFRICTQLNLHRKMKDFVPAG